MAAGPIPEGRRHRFRMIRLHKGWITMSGRTQSLVVEVRIAADGTEEWLTVVDGEERRTHSPSHLLTGIPQPCEVTVVREGLVDAHGTWKCVDVHEIYSPPTPDSYDGPQYRLRTEIDGKSYETEITEQVMGAAFLLNRLLLKQGVGHFRACGHCRWAVEATLRSARMEHDLLCFRDDKDALEKIFTGERGYSHLTHGVYYVHALHGCPGWEQAEGYDEHHIDDSGMSSPRS